MDKETLSNYGWIVICVLVLSVMIALATPFGSYVADGFKAAYNGFGDTNTEVTDMMYSAVGTKAPASCGIEGHYKGDNRGEHGIPATDCTKGHRYTCECVSWVVPEGGTYNMNTAVNGKSVYTAGEALPKHYEAKYNDTYEDGEYKYLCYNGRGWSARVIDTSKESYNEMLEMIANKPITDTSVTFYNCRNLLKSPTIPDSVTNMWGTFANCVSLTTAPKIPDSVTDMFGTFSDCRSLKIAPKIPDTVTDMTCTFSNCTSLTMAPILPSNLNKMGTDGDSVWTSSPTFGYLVSFDIGIFYNCTSLNTYENSADENGDFSNYKIPETVTNMHHSFSSCTNIKTAPSIPQNVQDLGRTFMNCYNISGTLIVNANNITSYNDFIKNTNIDSISGLCTDEMKNTLLGTK